MFIPSGVPSGAKANFLRCEEHGHGAADTDDGRHGATGIGRARDAEELHRRASGSSPPTSRVHRRHRPRHRRGPRPGAAVHRRPTSTPPPAPPAPPSRPGPPSRSPKRARAVFALREALVATATSSPDLVTQDMGKALDDARGEVGRGIESTEVACGIPTLMKGENLEGVATGRRRRDVAAAGRRRRRDHPVQLPGDDPALVPALRDRLREHVHPQAVGARPAHAAADRRADRRDRPDPGRRRQHRPRRPRRGQRPPRPPRDRRDQLRRPGLDGAPRDGAGHASRASASRRSAAPRTRWSSWTTPTSSRPSRR